VRVHGEGVVSDTVEKGDIVWLEYDAWTVNPNGTETLYDTTHEAVAKKEGKFEEKKVYLEAPVVVGRGRLFEGLEAAVLEAKVGESKEVLIPPDKGAGARDPRLVELRTEREFHRQEVEPEVGMEVMLGGRRGTVTAVSAGRVRVDFNNPLAGKTLRYAFKVVRKATTPEERVRAVIDIDYGLAEQFQIRLHDVGAEIQLPDVCKTDEKWFVSKFRVVADLRELTELRTIRFVEEYEKKEPKPEAKAPEKPSEEAKAEEAPSAASEPKSRRRATATKAAAKPSASEPKAREKAPEEL
jgi:peptidylprolyl isomerase